MLEEMKISPVSSFSDSEAEFPGRGGSVLAAGAQTVRGARRGRPGASGSHPCPLVLTGQTATWLSSLGVPFWAAVSFLKPCQPEMESSVSLFHGARLRDQRMDVRGSLSCSRSKVLLSLTPHKRFDT